MPALIESDDDDDDNDGTMPAQIESADDDGERMPALIVMSLQYLFYYNETATTEFRCCCWNSHVLRARSKARHIGQSIRNNNKSSYLLRRYVVMYVHVTLANLIRNVSNAKRLAKRGL